MLHTNITGITHPSSTTMGSYSSPTTAVPHVAAPTPANYPRPTSVTDQPAPYAAPNATASYVEPLWVAINPVPPFLEAQPDLYAAPTASAPYGSTALGPCVCIIIYGENVSVCPFDPSLLEPLIFCEDSL